MSTHPEPLQAGKPNQQVFADTLLALAEADPSILVVTSDSRGSGRLVAFGEKLPRQIVEMGIAEQNLVGVAAGLAAAGKQVFAVSPACFLTARSFEQIKNDVAYSSAPGSATVRSAPPTIRCMTLPLCWRSTTSTSSRRPTTWKPWPW
jgi:transketolase C-terminal domain/subunit